MLDMFPIGNLQALVVGVPVSMQESKHHSSAPWYALSASSCSSSVEYTQRTDDPVDRTMMDGTCGETSRQGRSRGR